MIGPGNGHIDVCVCVCVYWRVSVMAQDCIELQLVLFLSASWTLVGTAELLSVDIIIVYSAQ